MPSFSEIFKQHGLKMYASVLLGNLVVFFTALAAYFVFILLAFIFIGLFFATTLGGFDPSNPDSLDSLFSTGLSTGFVIMGILGFMIFMVGVSLLTAFLQAGTISVTIQPILEGSLSIGTFFVQGFKKMWKMFLLNLTILFLPSIPIILLIVFTVFAFNMGSGLGLFIGIVLVLATLLLSILCYLLFFHAPIVLVAENAGVFDSVKASIQLCKSKFGRVFGSSFYYFGIYYLLYSIGSLILIFLISALISGVTTDNLDDFLFYSLNTFSTVSNLYNFLIGWWVSPFFLTIVSLLVTLRYYKYLRPTLGLAPIENTGSNQLYFGLKSHQNQTNDDRNDQQSSSSSTANSEIASSEKTSKPEDEASSSESDRHSSSSDHESKLSWGFKSDSSSSDNSTNDDSGKSS
ncbi:hypothetical protein [Hazenella coriacea]|uniref:Glycerophosphoryl diester phosphodiesterase family protein n=1 Tax=Hazenella coriacea TaxID=1179467 RepID=A0A4V2UVQ0_9BACL|nr:hypothetical protein [Hazenella coriacea]TCS96657.1 hypothetical protein EDD58_101293 [Hazenella coriacea]